MSDLRRRLTKAAVEALGEHVYEASAAHATIQEAYWPIIEAELQKRDREIERLNKRETALALWWSNSVSNPIGKWNPDEMTARMWLDQCIAVFSQRQIEANKLLEQTIEVLEGLATAIDFYFVHEDGEGEKRARGLYESRQAAHALLDNLKAREKEPDAHQQAVKEILAPKPIDHVDGGFKP